MMPVCMCVWLNSGVITNTQTRSTTSDTRDGSGNKGGAKEQGDRRWRLPPVASAALSASCNPPSSRPHSSHPRPNAQRSLGRVSPFFCVGFPKPEFEFGSFSRRVRVSSAGSLLDLHVCLVALGEQPQQL
jgi:hypothetical protein